MTISLTQRNDLSHSTAADDLEWPWSSFQLMLLLPFSMQYFMQFSINERGAIAMHCNLRSPDVASVVLDFNHETHSRPSCHISAKSDSARAAALYQSTRFNYFEYIALPSVSPRDHWLILQPLSVHVKRSGDYLCAINASYTATGFVSAPKSCNQKPAKMPTITYFRIWAPSAILDLPEVDFHNSAATWNS